ncbi:transglycosylase SLT domain-containing protein [Nocardia carnea]|uniref:transglycosylase SLT domain-containing protein n=1 Tax=Nocardia carnea TaxID=37328 RepID=UPI002456D56F|nr:transglycosylase SLT domain-containing protein [Nocardia carnea]
MTLTIGDVEQWQPELLTTAAGHANTVSVRLDQLTGTAVTNTRALNWSGAAGAAASTRMDTERTRSGPVSAALLKIETALRTEVTNLIEAKSKVLRMRDAARDTALPPMPAFEVADDGTVSAQARIDHLRRTSGKPADSPEVQNAELGQRLVAATHQWNIVSALKTAEDTANRAVTAVQQAVTELETAYNGLGEPALNIAPEVPVATAPAATAPADTGGTSNGAPAATGSPSSSLMGDSTAAGMGSPAAAGVPTTMPTGDQKAWIDEAIRKLRENGYDIDDSEAAIIALIIERESGGDPHAINLWDSNAAAGIPSKGLMQTIDPTFNAYALPGHTDIWNPVDNIIAGTRYAIERYGSLSNVPGVVGVSNGTGYVGY